MSAGKWGESFLKSGLPLEHLTRQTLRKLGWYCQGTPEVRRKNREGKYEWFALDVAAVSVHPNGDTQLAALIECKYHDASRFWFFLPHDPMHDNSDSDLLNCAPVVTLANPAQKQLIGLAPCSTGGIVVSEDGTKQDNAVYTATQQIVHSFVDYVLLNHFSRVRISKLGVGNEPFSRVDGILSVIVTNASLYRLKASVSDLDEIRTAKKPLDIADEVPWMWLYEEMTRSRFLRNHGRIERHKKASMGYLATKQGVIACLDDLAWRPKWIAVINIKHFESALTALVGAFNSLKMKMGGCA